MKRIVVGLAVVIVMTAVLGWRSRAERSGGQEHPPGSTAAQEFKNIQVLQELPADQLKPAMKTYGQSLGVGCDFCHLRTSASDDSKPQKRAARQMILMTNAINAQNFRGEQKISCYTCHRGDAHPAFEVPQVRAPGN